MGNDNGMAESVFFGKSLGHMDDGDFKRLAQLVKTKYGLNLDGRKSRVESRLYCYVIDCGFDSFSEYLQTVYESADGTEMANIINRLTTNYTYFMREQEHFKHFESRFLPEKERTLKNKELCIWSAGCSFGNEAYNFAMSMEEYFDGADDGWDRKILATDISQNAILAAKRGMFAETAVKNLPTMWLMKYFTEKNGIYTVNDRIRSQVVFKYHNLMEPINFKKKFDLIICRNVMIYFDKKTKSELVKRFYDATKPGGYLYIGHAETMPEDCPYERERTAVYKKI
jgi:chemotaxis protein methyltransferase CheR